MLDALASQTPLLLVLAALLHFFRNLFIIVATVFLRYISSLLHGLQFKLVIIENSYTLISTLNINLHRYITKFIIA